LRWLRKAILRAIGARVSHTRFAEGPPEGYFEIRPHLGTSAQAWCCIYSAASARLLPRFSFILRRPTTIAFKAAGLTPLVMSERTSAR
jgi:hypothetical protein